MKLEYTFTADITEAEAIERAWAYLKPNWYRRIEGLPKFRRSGFHPGFSTPARSDVEIKLNVVPQVEGTQVTVTLENDLPKVDPDPNEDLYWHNVLNAVATSIRTDEAPPLKEDTNIRASFSRWRIIYLFELLIFIGGGIASHLVFDSFWLRQTGALPGLALILVTSWLVRKRWFRTD